MRKKVIVIGDIMLDVYHYVKTLRPGDESDWIYQTQYTEYRPGAAANVADCLENLGLDVSLWGHVDQDHASHIIKSWAQACNITTNWFNLEKQYKLRQNTRYIENNKCLLRTDTQNPENFLWENFDIEKIKDVDAVVLYDKGSLKNIAQKLINYCIENQIKVYVDPAICDYTRYLNAHCIKANNREWQILNACQNIKEKANWQEIIITNNNQVTYIKEAEQRFNSELIVPLDPVGAGDSFFSTWIFTDLNNYTLDQRLNLSALASKITLNKIGTYPPSRGELGIN